MTTTVITWGLPVEGLVAAVENAKILDIRGSKIIPADMLDPEAKTVYVCGTYFDDLEPIYKTCKGAEVVALLYSDEEIKAKKYGDVCAYGLIQDHIPYNKHPWMLHMIRRGTPDQKTDDEVMYRGLLHIDKKMVETFTDILNGDLDPGSVMETGRIVTESNRQSANYQVKSSAVVIKLNGEISAAIVSGSWNRVLPTAIAAAETAEIGINMRHNLRTHKTHFTFYTCTGADLTFVTQSPFNGGGEQHCKGCTVNGLVMIQPGKTLEQCVLAAVDSYLN